MVFTSELISLLLYSLQQLGVMLGVGAETILLFAYLITMRDGVVEKVEAHFQHAIRWVLSGGLILIIISGLGVATIHFVAGEYTILFAPVFLFKWVLIGIVLVCTVLIQKNTFSQGKIEMLAGGTWFALFIVHILAPLTTWVNLSLLYAAWLVGFSLCWYALTRFTKIPAKQTTSKPPPVISLAPVKKSEPMKIAPPPPPPPPPKTPPPPPKPIPPPPPKLAPVPHNLPAVAHAELPKPLPKPMPPPAPKPPPVVQKLEEKIKDPDESPFLPAIRVMPKTPEDVEKQHRATVVTFD